MSIAESADCIQGLVENCVITARCNVPMWPNKKKKISSCKFEKANNERKKRDHKIVWALFHPSGNVAQRKCTFGHLQFNMSLCTDL